MAKRAKKKSTTQRRAASASKKKQTEIGPSMEFVESAMANHFEGGKQNPEFAAQQFAYDAMEAMSNGDYEAASSAAVKAVELDPNCIDGMHILSQLGSEDESELIENLIRTLARGEKALGKKFFRENKGYFWGFLETRPYMRVKAELAQLLHQEGDTETAIVHAEEMLELNPSDNQGMRYPLLGWYLEASNFEEAGRLFLAYPEEYSAMFAWSRVLYAFLTEDPDTAADKLGEAREINPHVEPLLTGRKKLPKTRPDYYSPGEPSEAYYCFEEIGHAWTTSSSALEWLKEQ